MPWTPSPASSTSATCSTCGVSGPCAWPRIRATVAGSRRPGCSPRSRRSLVSRRKPRKSRHSPARHRDRLSRDAMSGAAVREVPLSAAPSSQPGARELDQSLLRGIAWTGGARWATQLLSWASTLVVARLLSPSDYGLVGMAMVYLGFVQLVNEFGLGAAIVTRRDLNEHQIARLGGFALLLGFGFVGLSGVVAAPMATFFKEPPVRWIVLASSLTFLTSALQILPRSLLTRDLDFRRLAWADGADALVVTCGTLLLAVLGLRYWAL